MDVAAWLRGLELGKYERAFRENDIDAAPLLDLTAEDLIELGVTSVGHRRKLLSAIADLCRGVPSASTPAAETQGRFPGSVSPEAERRQLTVMFVDLVGSTALASRIDPEEMGEVLRAYQAAVAGAISRFEGHIAKYMGDGILAYFGYPRTHEDEAERAVRAGLAASSAVHKLRAVHGGTLEARVGIATGPVVVGALIGEGAAREEMVVGETPNLAARLQTLAEPGAVVIAGHTRQLIGGIFDLAELGTHHLKGIPDPVRAWRVTGKAATESRFEALHGRGLSPLVGRGADVGLLLDRWERAKQGDGQVVLISGEPGIGKSRVVRALRRRLESEVHTAMSHYCSPYHRTSPLYPVIGQLERAAGFVADDPAAVRLKKLEALLVPATNDVAEVMPVLAALLSIDGGAHFPPVDLPPHRLRERTFSVLVDQLLKFAVHRPVLAIYEDVHWADPTSLELLDLVVNRVQGTPVLVLITFRPEFAPTWSQHAHLSSLVLGRLSRRQSAVMVKQLTGGKVLPAPLLEQIVAKADGVPLFLEELTRATLEACPLRDEGARHMVAGALRSMAIPTTLQDSLLARLDRLAPARDVAQVAAAIGREFSHALIAAATSIPEGDLQAALNDLVGSGLVFQRGTPPQATYSFKHALVRDAAYATLVRGKRQRLHANIAVAIEQRFPDLTRMQPELLAHHYTEAGLPEPAIGFWLRAGQQAIARSAMIEAIEQLQIGLGLLKSLPEGSQQWRQELNLQVPLCVALMATRGWAAPEAGRANTRARELCELIGASDQLWPALYGQWAFHAVRAEHCAARDLAEEFLRRAQQHQDKTSILISHRMLGIGAFWRGEAKAARDHLERTLALYDLVSHHGLALLYVQDPKVAALSGLSWTLLALGYPDQAMAVSHEALSAAKQLGHGNTLAYALHWACLFDQFCQAQSEAQNHAEALYALAVEQNLPHFLAVATMIKGWVLVEAGDVGQGLALLRQGLSAWRATGAEIYDPYFLGLQADALGRSGQAEDGLELIAKALCRVDETSERWFQPELHRLAGELLLQLPAPDTEAAEAQFQQAAELARRQSTKTWELRATTPLARMWAQQDRCGEAHDLLTSVYCQFTEGFETRDLEASRALLGEAAALRQVATPL